MQKKQLLWKLITLAALVVVAAVVVLLYVFVLKPKPIEGIKDVNVMIRVEDGEKLEERRYQVTTDALYFGDLLKALNEKYELGMSDAEIEAGFIKTVLGTTAPADGSKYFYYYTTNDALYNTEGEYFGGYVKYDDRRFGAPDYGVNNATLKDQTDYLLIYTAYEQYSETNPVPVLEVAPVRTESYLTEEGKNFDRRRAEAKNLLITVCCIAGAAALAIVALMIVETVKAKKA